MTKAAKKEDAITDIAPKGDNQRVAKYVERILKLTEERLNINADIKGIFDEAKNNGVDRKALKEVVKLYRTEISVEHRDTVNQYLEMLGKTRIYDLVG